MDYWRDIQCNAIMIVAVMCVFLHLRTWLTIFMWLLWRPIMSCVRPLISADGLMLEVVTVCLCEKWTDDREGMAHGRQRRTSSAFQACPSSWRCDCNVCSPLINLPSYVPFSSALDDARSLAPCLTLSILQWMSLPLVLFFYY